MSACHSCGGALSTFASFSGLGRVTSDCRPWPAGGALGRCGACGLVQKRVDAVWSEEVSRIYASYDLYHQSSTREEQVIFDATGAGARRSERLLAVAGFPAPGQGRRLLDVGCGTGPTLAAFAGAGGWELHGYEPHLKDTERLRKIPGLREIYTRFEDVKTDFDLVTLVHVLEHVVTPSAMLTSIRKVVAPEGRVLIHVPYFPQNAFDLLVADHCSHFGVEVLSALAEKSGFQVVLAHRELSPRELTMVLRPVASAPARASVSEEGASVEACLAWLGSVRRSFEAAASDGGVGVFGTSIAANWLLGILGDRVAFFVDEDPDRVGQRLAGRKIFAPREVPSKSRVLVPLAPSSARAVAERFASVGFELILPESAPAG